MISYDVIWGGPNIIYDSYALSYDFIWLHFGDPPNAIIMSCWDHMTSCWHHMMLEPPPPRRHNHVMSGPYDIMLKSYDMTYDVGGRLHNIIWHHVEVIWHDIWCWRQAWQCHKSCHMITNHIIYDVGGRLHNVISHVIWLQITSYMMLEVGFTMSYVMSYDYETHHVWC